MVSILQHSIGTPGDELAHALAMSSERSSQTGSATLQDLLEAVVRAVESVKHDDLKNITNSVDDDNPSFLSDQIRSILDVDEATLQSAFLRMRCSLRSRRNELALFRQLPNEIIGYIFNTLPLHNRIQVSQVCKHWRAVALSTPDLWNEINLNQLSQATVMLERSKNVALSVFRDRPSNPLVDALSIITPHFHRICSLRLLLAGAEMVTARCLLKTVSAPHLRHLTLNMHDPDSFFMEPNHVLFEELEVNLHQVSLHGVSLPWTSFCRGLTHLTLSNSVVEVEKEQFLDGLEKCPALQLLHLDRAGPSLPSGVTSYDRPTRTVRLDKLKTLRLTNITAINISHIISTIIVPPSLFLEIDVDLEDDEDLAFLFSHYPPQLSNILNISKLVFEGHVTDTGFSLWGFSAEKTMLLDLFVSDSMGNHTSDILRSSWSNIGQEWQVNAAGIKALDFSSVYSAQLQSYDFANVVGQFPSLIHLTITQCDKVDGYLDALGKRLCPHLKTLVLRDVDVSHDRLLMFVLSRSTLDGGLNYLELSDCPFIGAHTVRWLRDKVDTVKWDH